MSGAGGAVLDESQEPEMVTGGQTRARRTIIVRREEEGCVDKLLFIILFL